MITLSNLQKDIARMAQSEKASNSLRFFKTGKGEYGEGDVFVGLTVPQSRIIAKKYNTLLLPEIEKLLHSEVHEERLIALLILVEQFQRGNDEIRTMLYQFYLANTQFINNWDLVDTSADKIVGSYLFGKDTSVLKALAQSGSLWERRIAIIATFYFIKKGESGTTQQIAALLLSDKHDLIHKAVGWMLREVGEKCSLKDEEAFLKKNYKRMPRTMLRYAIEKFPENTRRKYLDGTI